MTSLHGYSREKPIPSFLTEFKLLFTSPFDDSSNPVEWNSLVAARSLTASDHHTQHHICLYTNMADRILSRGLWRHTKLLCTTRGSWGKFLELFGRLRVEARARLVHGPCTHVTLPVTPVRMNLSHHLNAVWTFSNFTCSRTHPPHHRYFSVNGLEILQGMNSWLNSQGSWLHTLILAFPRRTPVLPYEFAAKQQKKRTVKISHK